MTNLVAMAMAIGMMMAPNFAEVTKTENDLMYVNCKGEEYIYEYEGMTEAEKNAEVVLIVGEEVVIIK